MAAPFAIEVKTWVPTKNAKNSNMPETNAGPPLLTTKVISSRMPATISGKLRFPAYDNSTTPRLGDTTSVPRCRMPKSGCPKKAQSKLPKPI